MGVSAAAVGGDTLTGGSGANVVMLTSAGSANLGGVSKFPTIDLAAGDSTVTVTHTTLSGGGGAAIKRRREGGNNSISAADDTAASTGKTLTYNAGSGTDSFTGGFENDRVNVAAAAVGGDTLTGGSGTNTLVLTTAAGSVNLGGVSKFATIDLATGNNTVTVTDTTLSGGSPTLYDEASGNTISAAGDTTASTGKTLTYNAGAGTDSFATGGFENDTVNVSAAAVGGDTLTGGSGTNTLTLTSAGSANLSGPRSTINLAAGNSTVTVTDDTTCCPAARWRSMTGRAATTPSARGRHGSQQGQETLSYFAGTGNGSLHRRVRERRSGGLGGGGGR